MTIAAVAGRRSRRKRETRARILAAAGRLFARHGFAAVTVADVGTAAGVSAKTVFNYFPAKEGLFFADAPPTDDRLLRAVRQRAAGESAYEAVRRHATAGDDPAALTCAVRHRAPGESVYEAIERFRAYREPACGVDAAVRARVYADSAQLRAYAGARFVRQEAALADLLARDTGAESGDALPGVVAAALIAPLRWVFTEAQGLLAAGHPPAEVAQRRAGDLVRAYDLLCPGVVEYARLRP